MHLINVNNESTAVINAEFASFLKESRMKAEYKEKLAYFTKLKKHLFKPFQKIMADSIAKNNYPELPDPLRRNMDNYPALFLLTYITPKEMTDLTWCAMKCAGFIASMYYGTRILDRNEKLAHMEDESKANLKMLLVSYVLSIKKPLLMEYDDEVIEQLNHTDLGLDIPAIYLRAVDGKYNYIKLGSTAVSTTLPKINGVPVAGFYIDEQFINEVELATEITRLGLPKTTRFLNIVVVGRSDSLLAKHVMKTINLYITDDEMTITDVLQFNNKLLESEGSSLTHKPTDPEFYSEVLPLIVKAMVYLNVSSIRKEIFNEKTELLKEVKGQEKLYRNKLQTAYDRIVIRPPVDNVTENDIVVIQGSKKPHYRRGHIRMAACGEGRTMRRPVFIKPMLINKDKIGNTQPSMKNYVVKK